MSDEAKPVGWFPTVVCRKCDHIYLAKLDTCPFCLERAKLNEPPFAPSPTPHAAATFVEALRLIGGDRRADYGGYAAEAQHVAAMWNAILNSEAVQPRHVPLMMAALKLRREAVKHKADNLVDMCGYAGLLSELEGGK